MKSFSTFLLTIFISGQIYADCSLDGFWVFPEKKEIRPNTIIVLEGHAMSQKIVASLNLDYPIYLESDGHKVKLIVLSTYKGMYGLTQAMLQPVQKLIPGTTYELKIGNLDKDERNLLTRLNFETNEMEPISWHVESEIDKLPPKLKMTPKLVDKRIMHYGCGPEIYAIFKLGVEDETEILVKTELVDITNGISTICYLSLSQPDTLKVGHGMCSGAFDFKPAHNYKIRFNLVDSCGNTAINWSEWIEFESSYIFNKE